MRRKILRTVLITAAMSVLLVVSAYADSGVVTASDVNLRSGPGMNYDVIDCLAYGTEVTVNDMSNGDWYSITANGVTGFMSSRYVSVTSSAPAQSTSSSAEATINAMYVRFRSGPGTDSAILGEYNTGTPVTVTGTSGDWTAVVIDGQAGYVYSPYITLGTSQAAAAPTPTVAPTSAPTAIEVTATAETTGTICGDYVRFRSGPSTGNDILGTYNRGKAVTITGTSGDWTQCIIDGQSGYVYSRYVTADVQEEAAPSPAPAAESTVGYIKGNNVRFRSGPSTGYSILGEYSYGKALTITGCTGDWTAVVIDGTAGYVCSSYVAKGEITVPQSNNTDLGTQIASFALQYVGYNYCWGGKSPDTGFDCSGLVYYTYANFGYSLYRVADDMANYNGELVTGELQPGDILCFYSGENYVGHVGIYIGNGQFVHASSSSTGVIITDLAGNYTDRGYIAKRIV